MHCQATPLPIHSFTLRFSQGITVRIITPEARKTWWQPCRLCTARQTSHFQQTCHSPTNLFPPPSPPYTGRQLASWGDDKEWHKVGGGVHGGIAAES